MTKPFYLSVTIISSIVSGIAQLCGLFHINIADLVPQITDAIGQQINATISIAGVVGAIYGRARAKTQITLSPTSPAVRSILLVLAAGAGSALLGACAEIQSLQPEIIAGLSDLQKAATTAQSSGTIPAGQATSVVGDTSTTANALETIVTGQPITLDQALSVAKSFHSNSSTTNWIVLGTELASGLVNITNSLIAQGQSSDQVRAAQVQYLVNAPVAVQSALTPSS